ncbi:hypothetical protein J6590_085047 [Homalodisca vitripennis]|nr:hypothetical protein J6590_085047 [Homalodisca vitripennis]
MERFGRDMVRRAGGGNIKNQEQRGRWRKSGSRFGKRRSGVRDRVFVCGKKSFRRNSVNPKASDTGVLRGFLVLYLWGRLHCVHVKDQER